MSRALPDHAGDKPLEIWFQDEARIGQKGTLTRLWARTGRDLGPRAIPDTNGPTCSGPFVRNGLSGPPSFCPTPTARP